VTEVAAPGTEDRARTRAGAASAIGAFSLWGISPAYWRFFLQFGAFEVLVHRIIWAAIFLGGIIALREGFRPIIEQVKRPRVLKLLCISTVLIAINWLLFIWATMNGRVLDASLGYFMNPLANVAIGAWLLGERLNKPQMTAVALATIGVVILSTNISTIPWISLTLAITFAFYGYVRKTVEIEAIEGLFVETLLVTPIALGFFIWLEVTGNGNFFSNGFWFMLLLIFAGPFTSIPLVLYNIAARRLTLASLGITQYIAPTIHFILAVSYGEAITTRHLITFGLIWAGLAIYTGDAIHRETKLRRRMRPAP
jgi:chloramphenicol-sensitive protein RarD